MVRGRLSRVNVLVLLAALLAPAAVSDHAGDSLVAPYSVPVRDRTADGILGTPTGPPTAIVLFAHGYGHNVYDSWTHHVQRAAEKGYVAVAMDYGAEFQLREGADETIAAAEDLKAAYPGVPVVLFGVSMGGPVVGMAAAEAPGLFDHLVFSQGIATLHETWAAARAIGHPAADLIEAETGGTPAEVPEEYIERSPALRTEGMATNGLQTAIVVHPLNDGLVPYDQGREMAKALAGAGIPTQLYTVLRTDCDDIGTPGTGAILGRITDDHNPLCLSGHWTESSSTHVVGRTSFAALDALLAGTRVPSGYGEFVVDEGPAVLP